MLRLYAGRENIDKERFIYDSIKNSAGETFVLVPDQYTLVAEEQALKYMDTECLFDVEVISMNRLGLRVLTEQGTESVRMLDKYGRFMLLTKIIKEHAEEFEIFSRPAGKLAFTAMLNDFISEFKQQDCSADDLQRLLDESGDDPILQAKLRELSAVISAYEEAVRGRYTDSEDYISMYVSAIGSSKMLRGKTFWIYGYDSITPKFADAMLALAEIAESVNFVVNRSDFGLDERLTAGLARLAGERNIGMSCEEIGREYAAVRSETVSRIEKLLWKDVLSSEEKASCRDFSPEDLTLVCASNPYFEAENAAAYVWHLIRDLGYRMRDIQIIANDENALQPVIKRVFAEYGLPVFADSSRDITDSAAVSFIVELLAFVKDRGASRHLLAVLKTGLAGYSDEDIEELENYVRTYRIRGSMWNKPFRYGEEALGAETFAKLGRMRAELSEAVTDLKSITEADKVADFTGKFRAYLQERWHLGDKVEEAAAEVEAAGFNDEAQRMTQSYEKAVALLDQIDEIMGDSDMEIAEFTDIYIAGLSDVEVGVIPPSVDGLSMGTMIRTRPRQMRAAVIIGANEGVMPLGPATEGLFSVDEKEFFKKKGFALGGLEDIKMDEEQAAMYRMTARPSEKLYISWSLSDTEGSDASPSDFIDSLKALFPRIEEDGLIKKDMISEGWSEELMQTAADGMRHLVSRLRDRNAPEETDALTKALLRWYGDRQKDELDTMLKAASYDNSPKPLGKSMAKKLFGRSDGTLSLSASSIGSYIDCPFRFFIERGLKPKEERGFTSDSRSVGDVYHECLMAVARRLMSDDELFERIRSGADDETDRIVNEALDELSGTYRDGLFRSDGSEEYRMSRIREICSHAAKAVAAQLAAETLVDASFEESFSRTGVFQPIKFNDGDDEVYVEGRIDRTDIIDVGGEKRVRIIDYKTGSDSLDLWKMRQGLKMQLMIYLISASSGDLEPAGMFYFNIKDPIEPANNKSEKQLQAIEERLPEDEFRLKGAYINEDGVLDAMPEKVLSSAKGGISREEYEAVRSDVLKRIEETADGILSGRIGINPLKPDNKLVCNYCSYKSVCRRDRGYVKNAARTIAPKPDKNE